MKISNSHRLRTWMRPLPLFAGLLLWMMIPGLGGAYPLDGAPATGIIRLEGYRLAQEGKARTRIQPSGALLPLDAVNLRLTDHAGLTPGE